MGARGPGLKTLTDLVQEGCNGRNGRNGRPPGNFTVAEAILPSVGIPQLNPPGGLMVAKAILDPQFSKKMLILGLQISKFRLRRM